VIDLGSNTVLLLVLERGGRVVKDEAQITRLGQEVFVTGELVDAAIERTLEAVRALALSAREAGAGRVVAVGTAALRAAQDADRFLGRLEAEVDLEGVRVLTQEEEAAFTILPHLQKERVNLATILVIDVGGGSTEIAWKSPKGEVESSSLAVGSVRLTEAFVRSDPADPAELAALRRTARRTLRTGRLAPAAQAVESGGEVVAVAGTATTLAALDLELASYDASRVEGYTMTREQVEIWVRDLARQTVAERRSRPGMDPGRADVIVAGLIALSEVLGFLHADTFQVSGQGVRYGVALRLLEERAPVW
jgi:exopolyphosphatase/guanosine-5'-triphosphate,3'-diphosphate pyrophosphatase